MKEILIGSALLSMLHAILPNHWLPIIAIGQIRQWSLRETLIVTGFGAAAHSLSTVSIGIALGYVGMKLSQRFEAYFHWIGPSLLILLGIFFIYQHHRHKHFHLSISQNNQDISRWRLILVLTIAMLLSPCLEISGYFLMAGAHGWSALLLISAVYTLCTIIGMLLWVWWLYPHFQKLDWHALEHKAGLIAGWVLILTGLFAMIWH